MTTEQKNRIEQIRDERDRALRLKLRHRRAADETKRILRELKR